MHLGARAMGGAGLVFAEMACVSPEGRITPVAQGPIPTNKSKGWKRISDWIHTHTDAKFAMQIGHAGAKASTRLAWMVPIYRWSKTTGPSWPRRSSNTCKASARYPKP